jgi:hypothetical protein
MFRNKINYTCKQPNISESILWQNQLYLRVTEHININFKDSKLETNHRLGMYLVM